MPTQSKRATAATVTLSMGARQGAPNTNPMQELTMHTNSTTVPKGAIVLTTSDLIAIADTLGTARTRCEALAMCSHALDKDHRDAVDFLARDTDHIINLAVEALTAFIATGRGNGNG